MANDQCIVHCSLDNEHWRCLVRPPGRTRQQSPWPEGWRRGLASASPYRRSTRGRYETDDGGALERLAFDADEDHDGSAVPAAGVERQAIEEQTLIEQHLGCSGALPGRGRNASAGGTSGGRRLVAGSRRDGRARCSRPCRVDVPCAHRRHRDRPADRAAVATSLAEPPVSRLRASGRPDPIRQLPHQPQRDGAD